MRDAEVLVLWREAMKGQVGRPVKELDDNITQLNPKGTSRSYTVSRLQRESPELFAQVGVNLFFTLALTQKNFAPRGLNLHDYLPRFRLQTNRTFENTTLPYFSLRIPYTLDRIHLHSSA